MGALQTPTVLPMGMLLGKTIPESRASAWDGTKQQAMLQRGSRSLRAGSEAGDALCCPR